MPEPTTRSSDSYAFSAHPRQRRELERLRRQALIAWPEEKSWLARLGLRDGMRVLDVGCGPGVLTAKLAESNRGGETVGLEPDPALADVAAATLRGRPGVSLQRGSILENALPDAYFDFAYARFVIQHLSDPLAHLRGLVRVLRPGGRLLLVDADDGFTIFYPEPPELTTVMRALEARQSRAGGDRRIGRKLPSLLAEAGFGDVVFHVIPFTSHGLGRDALLELVVSSRLPRIETSEEPRLARDARRMLTFFKRHAWYGTVCVVAACGIRRSV